MGRLLICMYLNYVLEKKRKKEKKEKGWDKKRHKTSKNPYI